MNRTFDTRILILGLVVVCGLLARGLDGDRLAHDVTGSIPLFDQSR